jgi:DNA-binding CsgD family transcriptional regulator
MMNDTMYKKQSYAVQVQASPFSSSCLAASTINLNQTHHQEDPPILLQGIVESLIDGIMILSVQGEVIFANRHAHQICHELTENLQQRIPVPSQIWRSCKALIQGRETFPEETIVIEDEIKTHRSGSIRLRVRWLNLDTFEDSYLLVALEDLQQSAQNRAIAEAQKYSLTKRETQVWLLRRAGYSRKAIAAELYIKEDTVKKHIKSIRAKRNDAEWLTEPY